jgi:hypothetical protein
MSEMGSYDHLDIWNTSYGQNKGRKSSLQFDPQPLKVANRPDSLSCKWHVTYHWKTFNNAYEFSSDLISIEGLHKKLCAPKVTGVPILGISHLGVPGQNVIWMLVSWVGIEYTIRGEGGGFPQVQAVVSLVNLNCSCLVLAPKVFQLCINQLVFGFVQVRVNSWCLSFFLVTSPSSDTPLYPQSATS